MLLLMLLVTFHMSNLFILCTEKVTRLILISDIMTAKEEGSQSVSPAERDPIHKAIGMFEIEMQSKMHAVDTVEYYLLYGSHRVKK